MQPSFSVSEEINHCHVRSNTEAQFPAMLSRVCPWLRTKSIKFSDQAGLDHLTTWGHISDILLPCRSTLGLKGSQKSPDIHRWIRLYLFSFILSVKIWSISVPASPTRRRLGYPPRTPVPRCHSGSGARNAVLISPVLGGNTGERPSHWWPSSECGQRRLEKNPSPSSEERPPRQRAERPPSPLQRIWSLAVPSWNFTSLHYKNPKYKCIIYWAG